MQMLATTFSLATMAGGFSFDPVLLAQTTTTVNWIDQLILVVMAGATVFAVCRSTRRQ